MYSIDLAGVSLDSFEQTLTTVDLIPSRRILADHISTVVPPLKERGVADLEALRKLLADKSRYPSLAIELSVTEDYLTLLNREVNSYRSKPVALSKLEVFTEAELDRLAATGIRSTKDIYEQAATRSQRTEMLRQLDLADDRLVAALELSNLVRINGVGPAFAQFFRSLGVRGPEDVLRTDTAEILRRYATSVADEPPQPKLRVEDVEYCKRFSIGLSSDIEW